ncbi:MAG: molecular chaperone HtpG [Anaerolineales bacterium]
MSEDFEPTIENPSDPIAFQTEVKQLLNILIHSLYTEREIFLRELISNASDALTQMRFILQKEREVVNPEAEFEIRISMDEEEGILEIKDTGVGMTQEEIRTNLGTIAQSGARAFLEAAEDEDTNLADVIGQFGVGFYSVFMVAEWVKVSSRSYKPDAKPASWFATGAETFTIGSSDKEERGTTVTVKLKEDAEEFTQKHRLQEIIKKHSDYVAYPIYLEGEEEQVNRQNAIWRESPRSVEEEEYKEFYKHLTYELEPPLETIHFVADAPLKIFALLYIPPQPDRGMFTLRDENGLKLYARKVLIDEYSKDLLPQYYRFVQGVVDAEDLPLNVSRESVQASAVMARLKRILTNQVTKRLTSMASEDEDRYEEFWREFGQFIKEGVASDDSDRASLYPLLRFRTTSCPETWSSLDDYIERMKAGQDKIYYILGDDEHSVTRSPHLDYFQTHGYEVLILTDPVDSFMLMGIREYKEHPLKNVADSDLELPTPPSEEEAQDKEEKDREPSLSDETLSQLLDHFKETLGDRVVDVRTTDRLTSSVARLVDPEGTMGQEMQRVFKMMDRDFKIPKKILELNAKHPIVKRLGRLDDGHELLGTIIEQIFESALLIEGLHPDPAAMIPRIQTLMESALEE